MIFGSIGYTILSNSTLFPTINILLLYDSHDEQIKKCNTTEKDIQIDEYLYELLNKNYILMIEEVPLYDSLEKKKTLIGLWDDSNHIKNIRKFYETNKNNKNLIPFDIRFELIDSFDENDYNDTSLYDYTKNIFIFLMLEHHFFKPSILYTKSIDNSFIRSLYKDILIKFRNIIIPNKDNLNIKLKYFKDKKNIIDKLNDILSDIMEFYILIKLFDLIQSNTNIVIYGGLIHIDNIKKLLIKYYKFSIKNNYGITEFNEFNKDFVNYDNQCIEIPNF
jgi:hypothetical protein